MAKPTIEEITGVTRKPTMEEITGVGLEEAPKANIYDSVPPEEIEAFAKSAIDLAVKFETSPDAIRQHYMRYEEDLSAASQRSWKELESLQKTWGPISGIGIARESAKGAVRFAERDFAGTFGGTFYEWIGDFIEWGGGKIEEVAKTGAKNPDMLYNPYAQSIIATGQNISRTGREAREWWANQAATGWEALDPELRKTDPISYEAGKISEGVTSSALAVLAVYLSGGAAGGAALLDKGAKINRALLALASISAAGGYQHAKENYPDKQNFLWNTTHGLADGMIEYVMESTFLSGVGDNLVWAGPKEGAEEVVTGFLQNTRSGIVENTAKGMSAYEASKQAMLSALKQAPREFVVGLIGGELVVGGTSVAQIAQSSAKAVKRIAKPKGAMSEGQAKIIADLNAELAEIEQTLGVGPQAQQRRLEAKQKAEMKMVALDIQEAVQDLEHIEPEEGSVVAAQEKLGELRKPIPVVREGATQADIRAVEAEVAERPAKIQEAVNTLVEAQNAEIEQARTEVQSIQDAIQVVCEKIEKLSNLSETVQEMSDELADLSKPLSVIQKGKPLSDIESVDSLVSERDQRLEALQNKTKEVLDTLVSEEVNLSGDDKKATRQVKEALHKFDKAIQVARNVLQPTEPLEEQAQPPAKPKPKKIKPTEQKALWSDTTPTEDTKSDAAKVEATYNRADIELQRIKDAQKGVGKLWRKAKRAVWDTSASIKRSLLKEGGKYGKEAVIRHDIIKGSHSKSIRIINNATKDIYKGLNKDDIKTLDRLIQSRRIIAIDKYKPAAPGQKPLFATRKNPGGHTAEQHKNSIKNISEKTRKKLNVKADAYFKVMRGQLDQLREHGLISEHLHKQLALAGAYEPFQFIQHIDPERTGYSATGKIISVPDSGLKKLDVGSYEVLENDSQLLLSQVVNRTQARIARNNANQALWQMVQDVPANGIVQEAEIENISNLTTRAEYTYKPAPSGFEKISVVVDGVTRQMLMPTEMAKEWVGSDPLMNAQLGWWFGLLSGSKILKPMATGINPEFAMTNPPRDIAHILLTTEEYSPHLPVAIGQLIQDLNTVKKDAFTRKGRWLDYIDEGGGMEFLTHQGGVTSKATGALAKLQEGLGYMGETSEIWTRLALRERAIRNGKSNIEATWIARNYLDFSQGGNVAKAIDTAVPYFNASIQGTRGIFRAAQRNPKVFAYKAAQLGMLATGLMLANRHRNKEAWDSISSHDKANYFIFTTPFSYTDKEGEKRYLYFRVAKDQGQKMITSVFENLMAKYLGNEIDVDQVTDAARGIGIVAPSDMLPPTFDAWLGYYSNHDFWRNEKIWKRKAVIKKEEYTNYTHPAWVKVGEATGMSPEKTRHALQQIFTSGNIYTSMVDWGVGQVMDEMPDKDQEKITEDILRKQPFIRRILKATDPYNKHKKVVERIKLEEDTRIYKQDRELDALLTKFYTGKITKDEVDDFVYTKDISDVGRLDERRRRSLDYKHIPDRRWWLELSYAPPEAGANMYWARYNNASKAEKKKLDSYLLGKNRLPGIVSERFLKRLEELNAK